MIRLPNPIHTVALCLSACFVADAQAQTAETLSVHEFHYAPPSTLQSALDLRAGSYVLELRGPVAGAYLGRLRGPRNEWVAQDLRFVGNVCSGSAAISLSTETVPGTHGSNALRLVVGAGACRSEALLPMLGLTSIDVTHGEPDCDPPEEINQVAGTDDGPACSPPYEPELPIVAPRPDVKPRPQVQFAGRSYLWSDRIVLDASQAIAKVQGRCIFDYAYAVENVGRATSVASDGSLLLDSRLGLKLDARPLGALLPGASQRIQGRFALPTGSWRVYGHADANDAIGEWDGANNARVARIRVTGNCNS
jgi:hypothetical protein